MGEAIAAEPEPLVTLTHLLRLCRDEHPVLWERVDDPVCRARVAALLARLARVMPAPGSASDMRQEVRDAVVAALAPVHDTPGVVIAHAVAELLDERYGHTFAGSFARRSPYQPRVGDPLPLDSPDLRRVTDLAATAPPWRLANRLDETRRVRLTGQWAAQFRIVFDYCLADALTGLITADTVVATCHPNRGLEEFVFPHDDPPQGRRQRSFPVRPADVDRQRAEINRLIEAAVAAGASIVVLPELCVTEALAWELREWVRRPDGPRLLVAGSYHHETAPDNGDARRVPRRRNTALTWVRGKDRPLVHDKHSPADHPVGEDIQPQGWPELRVYVSADGWHLVVAICRDLLNPNAVHALTEAGANLVLVPAMSETLLPFGGPVAQLVGDDQALVAVANNPARWSRPGPAVARRAGRALFGHPGFGQQTCFVPAADSTPGVARLQVRSGELTWLPVDRAATPHREDPVRPASPTDRAPRWVATLAAHTDPGLLEEPMTSTVILRTAAVLVLVIDAPGGPRVLLTRRTPDLADYPGRLVFPGGATDDGDRGPVATALREAREEVGLDPDSVRIIGPLAPYALSASGFLVTPILAWSARPLYPDSVNLAEVNAVLDVPVLDVPLPDGPAVRQPSRYLRSGAYLDTASGQAWEAGDDEYGAMTRAVIGLLARLLTSR